MAIPKKKLLISDFLKLAEEYSVIDVADFGFSKNPDETFAKWGGHDIGAGTGASLPG